MKTWGSVVMVVLVCFCAVEMSCGAEPGYPTKPIEVAVGYAPGGGTDLCVRMLAEIVNSKKYLGQEVFVTNKPGGGGRVAMTLVAKSKPDGYTLAGTTDSCIILSPLLERVSYKPLEDLSFIARLGKLDFAVQVLPDSPFKTFKDLIDFARANPNKLTIGTVGEGTANHVALEVFGRTEKIQFNLVPFAGIALTMPALLGRHVMAASTAADFAGYAEQAKQGKLRLLAVMGDERMEEYPSVPTLKELGYPYMVFQSWFVISGPKHIDKSVSKKLEEAFKKALESPDYIKFVKNIDSWAKIALVGDEVGEGMVQRYKKNEELFRKLGMLTK
jgi:tripartite-type tricarboxylate transporter receptor subunit TctC